MSDDLIRRAEAIDEMSKMYHAAEKWGQEAEDDTIKARAESCMASLVEMKLRVEKLPSAEPRWIPCSERLPEKHGDYLVTATGESQGKKYIRVEIGQWLGDAFWIGWYEPNKKILAWMPLPQPWKGENDG